MTFIFAGYFFIFFHLKINSFDLLPDFLGYLFIVKGLTQLESKSSYFTAIKPWAIGMGIFNLLLCFAWFIPLGNNGLFPLLLNVLDAAILLYITYSIILGIQDIESAEDRDLGSKSLLSIWKVQTIVTSLSLALSCFIFIPALLLILTPLILGSVITNIVFLVYFNRSKNSYQSIHEVL